MCDSESLTSVRVEHGSDSVLLSSGELKSPRSCEPLPSTPFGGRYVPEAFYEALDDLRDAFEYCLTDPIFWDEFEKYYTAFSGLSGLQLARNLTQFVGGAQIFLKREDLKWTGTHNITNALGQALLARRLGYTQVITETGSGSHGVATAAVCRLLELGCVVYMGATDILQAGHQRRLIERMGATVVEVFSGAGTLREASNDALRAMLSARPGTYLLAGGPNGPDPYPSIVGTFQAKAGREARCDIQRCTGRLPDAVVASAGAHGPAVGMFLPFINNVDVALMAVEGGGEGMWTNRHAAVLSLGAQGVFRGARTLVLQDEEGQIGPATSIAPDFCDPVASPLLALWTTQSRVQPIAITNSRAREGRERLRMLEEIDCSWEDGHAVIAAMSMAESMSSDKNIVLCVGARLTPGL